jgi:hypothetical protein
MHAPKVIDFPDPAYFNMEVEIFKDHVNMLRMVSEF